jgi:hypothetical protein
MTDKVVKAIKRGRADMWDSVVKGLSITGYKYYKPHESLGIHFRYPAPGSGALDWEDHPNLYKQHWKTPFRQSEYNISQKEKKVDRSKAYIGWTPELDPNNPTDAKVMMYQQLPIDHHDPLFEKGEDMTDDAHRDILWSAFEEKATADAHFREDNHPGTELEDTYNPIHWVHHNRGVTAIDGNSHMKEVFVSLETFIEEDVVQHRVAKGAIETYKGQPKKWQILDDDCFDRDQIRKIQAAADAPMPEQLEAWKEKHENTYIQIPLNNANVSKWRDDERAIDTADFDPKMLAEKRS